jgi:hypothetical protein
VEFKGYAYFFFNLLIVKFKKKIPQTKNYSWG